MFRLPSWRGTGGPTGRTLDLHADPDASAAAIRAFAGPKAETQFRRFSATAAALFRAFDAPVMQRPKPDPAGIATRCCAAPA